MAATIEITDNFALLPLPNTVSNTSFSDTIGNKTDNPTNATGASIIGLLKYLINTPYNGIATTNTSIGIISDTFSASTIFALLNTIISSTSYNITNNTFTYLDAGLEQIILSGLGNTSHVIGDIGVPVCNSVLLDMTNITNNGEFKFYGKIDGTNYVEIKEYSKTFIKGTNSDGIVFNIPELTIDWKLTYIEGADEGSDKTIPYIYKEKILLPL